MKKYMKDYVCRLNLLWVHIFSIGFLIFHAVYGSHHRLKLTRCSLIIRGGASPIKTYEKKGIGFGFSSRCHTSLNGPFFASILSLVRCIVSGSALSPQFSKGISSIIHHVLASTFSLSAPLSSTITSAEALDILDMSSARAHARILVESKDARTSVHD